MFGLSLKEKTQSVIENEFHYVVSHVQRHNFSMLVSEGKSLGQNEYSIAIMYMLTMMNSIAAPFEVEGELIDPKEGRNEEEKEQFENFINTHIKIISEIKHLANSPESDIQEMVDLVLINAGLSGEQSKEKPEQENTNPEDVTSLDNEINEEEEDVEEASNEEVEDTGEVETLMKATDAFTASMVMADALMASSSGAKYLSPYQLKIVYGLQLLGAIDCVSQQTDSSMTSCMAVLMAYLPTELFGFDSEESTEAFHKIIDLQSEPWAQQIIISGGNAVIKIFSKENEDMLPTMEIFDDTALMQEVAKKL